MLLKRISKSNTLTVDNNLTVDLVSFQGLQKMVTVNPKVPNIFFYINIIIQNLIEFILAIYFYTDTEFYLEWSSKSMRLCNSPCVCYVSATFLRCLCIWLHIFLPCADPSPHHYTIPTVMSPSLPWPVIIGIPAGVVFILGTVLLWLCQSKKQCSSSTTDPNQALPNQTRQPARDWAPCTMSAGDKEHMGSFSYEEYVAQQQQLLLPQGGVPKVYPKIYTDIHTHTHSHVDGKVHQHQHIHYQC